MPADDLLAEAPESRLASFIPAQVIGFPLGQEAGQAGLLPVPAVPPGPGLGAVQLPLPFRVIPGPGHEKEASMRELEDLVTS